MITKETVIDSIRKYINENFLFGDEAEEIKIDDSFMENGIIDSTGILELIEFVEQSFNITVEDDELIPENLDSLGNLSRFILMKNGVKDA